MACLMSGDEENDGRGRSEASEHQDTLPAIHH
jgi:hypothetical protein